MWRRACRDLYTPVVSAPAVTFTALAPVIEIVAPSPAVTSATPATGFEYVASEPAVIDYSAFSSDGTRGTYT